MKRIAAAALMLALVLHVPFVARAQAPAPEVIGGTVSISTDLRTALETYLLALPPSTATYYAPTFVQYETTSTLVSLAGLNLQAPGDPWTLESRDDQPSAVIWVGTVRINADGSGQLYSTPQGQARNLPRLAIPILPGPGGGSYVRLPFQPGKAMQYGPRLIHGSGDYGTSGMYAVDLVGGTSLGSNVAPATIYASTAGTVDYVCADDTSVAVRTYNAASDDYFVYAHLLDNANLELDHVFAAGGGIGTLKYGGFDDTCGWAEQADNIYHIHWMFEPGGGIFRVGAYTINIADKKFHTGTTAIGVGGWVTNNITGTGIDDPSGSAGVQTPSIWDGIINAIGGVVNATAMALPAHNSASDVLRGILNTVVLSFKLTWLLLRPNLHLAAVFILIVYLISTRFTFWIIWIIWWAIRVFRQLKQAFWPMG